MNGTSSGDVLREDEMTIRGSILVHLAVGDVDSGFFRHWRGRDSKTAVSQASGGGDSEEGGPKGQTRRGSEPQVVIIRGKCLMVTSLSRNHTFPLREHVPRECMQYRFLGSRSIYWNSRPLSSRGTRNGSKKKSALRHKSADLPKGPQSLAYRGASEVHRTESDTY